MRGSLINRAMEKSKQKTPEVGMGATILGYTDRNACTIISVEPKRITVQRDNAIRTDENGMSEIQRYDINPNPNGVKSVFTLRKNGRWVRETESSNGGTYLLIGERQEYYDFSF